MRIKYLLDANIFIEAKNLHYPHDVFPAYWSWLIAANDSGHIGSVESIYDELTKSTVKDDNGVITDPLHVWTKELDKDRWFLPEDDDETQMIYADIANWVESNSVYTREHKDRFFSGADPLLIAKAKSLGCTIVTHEKPVPENSAKVKIPNICRHFNVPYINNIQLMRTLEASI